MNSLNHAFGERVAILRIGRCMTREQFAEIVGISERFLYDIESGKKGCGNEVLLRLSKALCVSSDYLLTGETNLWEASFPAELANIVVMLSTLSKGELAFMERMIRDCIDFSNYKHYLVCKK